MNVTINANVLVLAGFLLICAAYWLGVPTRRHASSRALQEDTKP